MSKFGFSRFRTSRGRLLAILIAVLAPIGGLMAFAAWTNYKFTAASLDRDYALLTANYEGRIRVWIRGIERSLVAAVSGVASLAELDEECQQAVRRIVSGTLGFKALHVALSNGNRCFYSIGPALPEQRVAGYARQALEGGIVYTPVAGPRISDTRLFFSREKDMRDIVFVAQRSPGDGIPGWTATLLVDLEFLGNVIAMGETYRDVVVALILPDRHVVASLGLQAMEAQWQPQAELPTDIRRWSGQGSDGTERIYAIQPIFGRDLSILAAFSVADMQSAWWHFLVLLGMPFLVLASLTVAFLRASDLYIIRWLRRLEGTARARSQLKEVRVDISPSMPSEIRSFSMAFNDMADAEEARRAALQAALDDNRFLVRELHHRVKNSLQVIQSYLAIERRAKQGQSREVLVDAELRVHILSIAYRIALADGVIRPVDLADFLGQMAPLVSNHVFQRGQVASVETAAGPTALDLEKIAALGFLIADVLLRAAKAEPEFKISLVPFADEETQSVEIRADRAIDVGPEPRINRGLCAQLGATPIMDPVKGRIAGWRWRK